MNFFSNIHEKSDSHKRRFALTVSFCATMFIFTVWSFTKFNAPEQIVENKAELSPLASLTANVRSSFTSLKQSFIDLNSTVDTYGGQ